MLRGIVTCKCACCGAEFRAPDIEWNATAKSAPVRCPKCGMYNDVGRSGMSGGFGMNIIGRLLRKIKGN